MALAECTVAFAPVDLIRQNAFGIMAEATAVHFDNTFKLGCFTFIVGIK